MLQVNNVDLSLYLRKPIKSTFTFGFVYYVCITQNVLLYLIKFPNWKLKSKNES